MDLHNIIFEGYLRFGKLVIEPNKFYIKFFIRIFLIFFMILKILLMFLKIKEILKILYIFL